MKFNLRENANLKRQVAFQNDPPTPPPDPGRYDTEFGRPAPFPQPYGHIPRHAEHPGHEETDFGRQSGQGERERAPPEKRIRMETPQQRPCVQAPPPSFR